MFSLSFALDHTKQPHNLQLEMATQLYVIGDAVNKSNERKLIMQAHLLGDTFKGRVVTSTWRIISIRLLAF